MISVPLNSVESSSLGVRAGLIDVIGVLGELDDDDWSFGDVLGVPVARRGAVLPALWTAAELCWGAILMARVSGEQVAGVFSEVLTVHAGFVCVLTTVTGVCTATGWSGAVSGIQ